MKTENLLKILQILQNMDQMKHINLQIYEVL
jgi:hypothetical protein